ncbi:hypothetical protein BDZ89DRAFT_1148727 [Hymenopellis radicata]|nr:hypothetical protein BDZ89DRAFT_1148727 [Hymenopellis radicata]
MGTAWSNHKPLCRTTLPPTKTRPSADKKINTPSAEELAREEDAAPPRQWEEDPTGTLPPQGRRRTRRASSPAYADEDSPLRKQEEAQGT